MRSRHAKGFTLIELIVVIAIDAILLAVALPSFIDSMRSNRVATTTNLTMATLLYARSEALRSKSTATVCPKSADNSGCGSDWNSGMLVWTDENRNGSFDTAEVKRIVDPNRDIIMSGVGGLSQIGFDARGRSAASASQSLSLKPGTCKKNVENVRTISVAAIGQVAMQREKCP